MDSNQPVFSKKNRRTSIYLPPKFFMMLVADADFENMALASRGRDIIVEKYSQLNDAEKRKLTDHFPAALKNLRNKKD